MLQLNYVITIPSLSYCQDMSHDYVIFTRYLLSGGQCPWQIYHVINPQEGVNQPGESMLSTIVCLPLAFLLDLFCTYVTDISMLKC